MTRNRPAAAAVVSLLFVSGLACAAPGERPCGSCSPQAPILDSGRPSFPGDERADLDFCTRANTSTDRDCYGLNNSIPDCPRIG